MTRESVAGIAAALLLGVMAGALSAQNTFVVTLDSTGAPAGSPGPCRMTPDGRFLVFASQNTGIVPGDTNGAVDIFLRDMQNDVTTRVSLTPAGGQTTGDGFMPDVNGDGSVVVFRSTGTDFAPGGLDYLYSIVVRNVLTGATVLASANSSGNQANDFSDSPRISRDGHSVVFESFATDIVPGVPSGTDEVYLHDLVSGVTELISVDVLGQPASGSSGQPSVSGDGRFVAFSSGAPNLVAGDTNGTLDVFVRDRLLGVTQRVSVDSAGAQANAHSQLPAISADGTTVAFNSGASNLVGDDTNFATDIFVHELSSGATLRVSVDSSGAQGNASVFMTELSDDGRRAAFQSGASNLVPGDTNANMDVFVHDLTTHATEIASVHTDGSQFAFFSEWPNISGNGRYVTFMSSSPVPGDVPTIWRRDTLVPIGSAGPGLGGAHGVPTLTAAGAILPGTDFTLTVAGALEFTPSTLFAGLSAINAPFKGGIMVPAPDFMLGFVTDGTGGVSLSALWPAGLPSGPILFLQYWFVDPAGPAGYSGSNALSITVP